VVSPSAALVGFLVNKNLHAKGSHGHSVEREGAFKSFVGGEEGVLSTGAEHVEGGITLFGEAAPVRNGEGLREAGDAQEEVILQLRIAHSAGLVRCMSSGVYRRCICCPWMNFLTSCNVSLSILCRRGLKPRTDSHHAGFLP
jgi:hypothetical protein